VAETARSGAEITADISAVPLDIDAAIAAAFGPALGGIASFIGTVRSTASVDEAVDKAVVRLEYEAHPTLAVERLRSIAADAALKWDVHRVVAIHRTGTCELGDPTVVVACGAPHRRDALQACRWIIDTIKAEVPIWKREVYADYGGSAWVGTP
jgi:molybdopterin synthase catalytic subunit